MVKKPRLNEQATTIKDKPGATEFFHAHGRAPASDDELHSWKTKETTHLTPRPRGGTHRKRAHMVYFSDPEWADLSKLADSRGVSISELLRHLAKSMAAQK